MLSRFQGGAISFLPRATAPRGDGTRLLQRSGSMGNTPNRSPKETALPPRRKSAPAAAPAAVDPAVVDALSTELATLEKGLQERLARIESDCAKSQIAVVENRRSYERLLADAAARIAGLEKAVAGIQQHNKDHDIAAATRRAATASRVKSLEGQIESFIRNGTDSSTVSEDQIAHSLRNLWMALVGVGGVAIGAAVKAFVG